MSTDWYTKLVLTVVAACLGLMVVQGYLASRAEASASGSEGGRYLLVPMPMARMMLRFDSDTGRTWKAALPDLKNWTPIVDAPAEALDEATPEAAETPEPTTPPAPDIMIELRPPPMPQDAPTPP